MVEAEAVARQILARDPSHAQTLHLLGTIARQKGQVDVAENYLRKSVAIRPALVEAHFDLGNVLRDRGKADEAMAAYRDAIAQNPGFARAHCNLGNILSDKGEVEAAILSYRDAIAARADLVQAYHNLGIALGKTGQLSEAVAACRQAAALAPGSFEVHRSFANALVKNRQYDEAVVVYQKAIALRPDFPKIYVDLGHLLLFLGRLDELIAAAENAVSRDASLPHSHFLLGAGLAGKRRHDAAIAAYRAEIAHNPGFAMVHCCLGAALNTMGRIDEAVAACRQAVAIAPGDAGLHSGLVIMLHYHPDYDAREIAEECRRWNERHALPLARPIQPHPNRTGSRRRLRIGYVSPDFGSHPVGRCVLPLFRQHDREQFEIFAYAHVAAPDVITEEFQRLSDCWRNIAGLADQQVADQIRADQIDILVDLSLHSTGNRLLIFARKPAPVQITWLGYPGSTGLDAIDYRLTDPYFDPIGMDESIYSEKTIRLPETYWCYPPSTEAPEVNSPPATQSGHVTFGCLNNFAKVSDSTLMAWGKILAAVPGSRLMVHAYPGTSRDRVRKAMGCQGIEPHRIEFTDRAAMPEYFRLYHRIDIGLDTLPFAGGITTCDALWMGVPVVTQAGKTVTGRGGCSILSNIGLPELITHSEDEYVHTAVKLARNLPRLAELRCSLRARMQQSPLMDTRKFVRHIESAFQTVRTH